MTKKILVAIMLGILHGILYFAHGQNPNPIPANTITAPSINGRAPAFANFYSGQPQIAFPLFSYEGYGLSHNILMTYNATGTTLEQAASSVGLGWTFTASSFVKRIVSGTPDEFKYYLNNTWNNSGYFMTPNVPVSPTKTQLDNLYNNKTDGEADIYIYNLNGQSGRIIVNKNAQAVQTTPKSNLAITINRLPGQGRINQIIIKTESGIIYEFSDEEIVTYKTKIDNSDVYFDYTSTWFLTRTYSVISNIYPITFEYATYHSEDVLGKQSFSSAPRDPNVIAALGSVCIGTNGTCCYQTWNFLNENVVVKGELKRLTRINLPDGGKYNFNYKFNSRCDMPYEKALESVEFRNSSGIVMKKFMFDYSYFSSNGEIAYLNCYSQDLSMKLKLNSITEITSASSALPPLIFEYETSINLPERTSTDVDEWGFLPKTTSLPNGGSIAYILKKITYPTGSYSTYDYELNTVGWTRNSQSLQILSGLRIKKISIFEGTNIAPANTNTTEITYTYNNATGSSGQVDYLPIKEFSAWLDIKKIAPCVVSSTYSNVEMKNRLNHSPISSFPTGNACGYSQVTEEIKGNSDILGRNVYFFKNFSDYTTEPSLIGNLGIIAFPYSAKQYNIPWGLGLLIKVETYDKDGNIIKKTENSYNVESYRLTASDLASLKVGLWYGPTNRSSSAINGDVYKYELYNPLSGETKLNSSKATEYFYQGSPILQKEVSKEVINEYVPNRSLIRSKYTFDSRGNKVRTVYYYPFDYNFYGPFGVNPAIGTLNLESIITPVISTETWITKNSVNYLISSEVQGYFLTSNGMVRPSKSYLLKTNFPIPESQVAPFNGNTLLRDPNLYREINSNDFYNDQGMILQQTKNSKTINSSIYGYNGNAALATISNSRKDQVAYSSFEDIGTTTLSGNQFGGFALSGTVTSNESITGNKAFSGQLNVDLPTGNYVITLWVKNSSIATVTAPQIIEPKKNLKTIAGWTLCKWVIGVSTTIATVNILSNGSYVDEVRVYPINSNMSTVTYNDQFLKLAECDINNLITYYRYDKFNRLKAIVDYEGNVIKTFEYNFKQ